MRRTLKMGRHITYMSQILPLDLIFVVNFVQQRPSFPDHIARCASDALINKGASDLQTKERKEPVRLDKQMMHQNLLYTHNYSDICTRTNKRTWEMGCFQEF